MDKKQNKEEIRYRCYLCKNVMNEHHIILPQEKRDKYKDIYLSYQYCKECWEYIEWERNTYDF